MGDNFQKINYLSNKELLSEIHKSKNSFCEYIDKKYIDYDNILFAEKYTIDNIDETTSEKLMNSITLETIEEAKKKRAARLTKENIAAGIDIKVQISDIKEEDLVFRVITYEHIPDEVGRKKNPKTQSEMKTKLSFTPFKHFIKSDNMNKEVGRSHCLNGSFSSKHGRITNQLATMFILLTNKYSQRANWRGYSYLDEMKGSALLQLCDNCLSFNEYKSDNPFAYFTMMLQNQFTRVLNVEKVNQNIRDDLLEANGIAPSMARQLSNDDYSQTGHFGGE